MVADPAFGFEKNKNTDYPGSKHVRIHFDIGVELGPLPTHSTSSGHLHTQRPFWSANRFALQRKCQMGSAVQSVNKRRLQFRNIASRMVDST
jgi:hypothetical protein